MISRNRYILGICAVIAGGIGIVVSLLAEAALWRWLSALLFVGCTFFFYWGLRCPHCGHVGLAPRLSEKDAGYCSFCGEPVEWKEYQQ